MRRTLLAVTTTAVVSCGLLTGTASAATQPSGILGGVLGTVTSILPTVPVPTTPSTPSTAAIPGVSSVVGTGTDCAAGGLVTISLGGTTVCVAPTVAPIAGTTSCSDGGIAVEIAGQGVACLPAGSNLGTVPGSNGTACDAALVGVTLPSGGNLLCVVPTDLTIVPDGSTCTTGLIPVTVLGGGVGCVVAGVIGGDGTNGAGGANGTNGVNGAGGTSGSGSAGGSGTGSGANGSNGTTAGTTGAAGSSSRTAAVKVYKPTLTLAKKVKKTSRGTIRSSTAKVVLTIIGHRHGRTVRYTKQLRLRKTGKTGAARPYSAKVTLKVTTKGKIRLRLTSRAAGNVKSANFTRTVVS
jgi:hypothetical protein